MESNIYICAAQSYKFGLDFLLKHIESQDYPFEDSHGFLRMAIICIHNTLELLIKARLMQVNELLIISNIGERDLLDAIKIIANEESEYFMYKKIYSSTSNIKTIDYRESLDRYFRLFDEDSATKEHLIEIGNYRNSVTHLGIDKNPIEHHEIYRMLLICIELIEDKILYGIDLDEPSLDLFLESEDLSLTLIYKLKSELKELIPLYYSWHIDDYRIDIENAINSDDYKNILTENNLTLEYSFVSEEFTNAKLIIKSGDDNVIELKVCCDIYAEILELNFMFKDKVSLLLIDLNKSIYYYSKDFIDEELVYENNYWNDKSIFVCSKYTNTESDYSNIERYLLKMLKNANYYRMKSN